MREYVTIFLVALTVTYLLCVVAREIAHRTGAEAKVRQRDMHEVPVPYFGGIAMYGGLVAAFLVAQHLPFLGAADARVFDDGKVVLAAGGLICLLGVLDDLFEMDALVKLLGQLLAAGFLVAFGVRMYLVQLPGAEQFSLQPDLQVLITLILVVGTVNAVNFVDGLDGLAAGIIGIGAVAFFGFSYYIADLNGETLALTPALLCAALAGACAGFLPHNIYPARMFMGDSGSMLIGLVLAASALTLTGQFPAEALTSGVGGSTSSLLVVILPLVLPLAILIVPFADLALAVVRRTRAGRSPFAPDKQHLHHRLVEIGHSHRRAVLIMWVWAALVAFGGVLASLYPTPETWATLAAGFVGAVVATFVLPVIQPPHLGHQTDDIQT
ncbi:MAG TPA: MraY family glycosyltransferase [Nocardioidaceae bacterium]|nr:MraY family glycosyltransferase [Nocardioidaceae bacterium]